MASTTPLKLVDRIDELYAILIAGNYKSMTALALQFGVTVAAIRGVIKAEAYKDHFYALPIEDQKAIQENYQKIKQAAILRHNRKNNEKTMIPEEEIAECLEATEGLKTHAAKLLGCSFICLNRRVEESQYLKDTLAEAKEEVLDNVEKAVRREAEKGSFNHAKYILDFQGDARGFGHNVKAVIEAKARGILKDIDKQQELDQIPKKIEVEIVKSKSEIKGN